MRYSLSLEIGKDISSKYSKKRKVGLSPSKKNFVICLIESPLKVMKKCFLFHFKSSFRFQVI